MKMMNCEFSGTWQLWLHVGMMIVAAMATVFFFWLRDIRWTIFGVLFTIYNLVVVLFKLQ